MSEANKIAMFFKVHKEQFQTDLEALGFASYSLLTYANINLPERATSCSAGYDICSPVCFTLKPGQTIVVPTGIRCKMDENYFLALVPRSSVGIKRNVSLMNTIGIVDADYYYAENEGHIMLALKNNNKPSIFPWINKKRSWTVCPGERICQGIFLRYGITDNDKADRKRTGGIGSTGE